MRLSADTVLHAAVCTLREQVALATDDPFILDLLRMTASQVEIVAHAWDDAAALRVAENGRLRALFGEVDVSDAALATDLAQAARSADPGLRITELDAENGRLRALLVRLHIHIEGLDTPEAAALDRRLWALLVDIEQARAPRS